MSENQVNTYYVSTKGDDSNPGTLELPFAVSYTHLTLPTSVTV